MLVGTCATRCVLTRRATLIIIALLMMPAYNALLGRTLGLLIWQLLRLPRGLLNHLSMPLQLLKQLVRVGHVLFIVLHKAGTVYLDRIGCILEFLELFAPHSLLFDRFGPEKHHLVLQKDCKWLCEVFRQALKLLSCLWT